MKSTLLGMFIFAIVFVIAKESLDAAIPMLDQLGRTGFLDEVGAAGVASLVEVARRLLIKRGNSPA